MVLAKEPFACRMQSACSKLHGINKYGYNCLFLSTQYPTLPSIMRPDTCTDFNTNLTQIEQKFWHPILGSKHSHYGMVTGSRKEKKRNGAKGGMKGRKRKGWTVRWLLNCWLQICPGLARMIWAALPAASRNLLASPYRHNDRPPIAFTGNKILSRDHWPYMVIYLQTGE